MKEKTMRHLDEDTDTVLIEKLNHLGWHFVFAKNGTWVTSAKAIKDYNVSEIEELFDEIEINNIPILFKENKYDLEEIFSLMKDSINCGAKEILIQNNPCYKTWIIILKNKSNVYLSYTVGKENADALFYIFNFAYQNKIKTEIKYID